MPAKRLLSFVFAFGFVVAAVLGCGEKNPQGPTDDDNNNNTIPRVDTVPPADVLDLVVKSPRASAVTLVWVSPGDDGSTGQAASYQIRRSMSPITEQDWDTAIPVPGAPAPKRAGEIENFVVGGLQSEADHYFALKTSDEVPNQSAISNCPVGTTLPMGPAAIADLKSVAVGNTEFLLTWTASGDDDMAGTASYYDIRYSTSPITSSSWNAAAQATGEPLPKASGEPDSFVVTGLTSGVNYYFAMMVADETPLWSLMSNLAPAFAFGRTLWVTPQNVYIGDEIQIVYQSSPAGATAINIWGRAGWNSVEIKKHLVTGISPPDIYVVAWDLTDDAGRLLVSYWAEQYTVRLLWDGTTVDSAQVRIHTSE